MFEQVVLCEILLFIGVICLLSKLDTPAPLFPWRARLEGRARKPTELKPGPFAHRKLEKSISTVKFSASENFYMTPGFTVVGS